MVLRCAWGTCNADERYPERLNGGRFILFPKPKTELEKCKRWIKNCGRPHEQLNLERVNKHKAVCSSVSKLFCLFLDTAFSTIEINYLGPVVQRPISSNPALNFNPAFFISLLKSLLGKIFTILFRTSNDQIASKKI